jgi:prepilin-type N-terminal cleavage/methylation domain-containing protein
MSTEQERVTAGHSTSSPAASGGFTLVELLVVTAVLAVIAGIAVPFVISSRITANEAAAIATLKAIGTAQTEVRSGNWIDSDSNGVGEYGFLQELSGVRNIRRARTRRGSADAEGTDALTPPFLAASFGGVDTQGQLLRSGYLFRVYLPRNDLRWLGESSRTRSYRRISSVNAENYWAVYAWPRSYGSTGKRAFFINQTGQILACGNGTTRYSENNPPEPEAVIMRGSASTGMDGPIAVNSEGNDRNIWRVVR